MQQLRVICYPSDTPCFSKLTRIQPGTFSYDIFSGQYVTLYAVSKKYFTESKKTLQIKAGQNGVSVNQCFSLYCYFFFQTSAFFVSKSAFRQASFEENKTFFFLQALFPLQVARSNWETPRTWACYSLARKKPLQEWECATHQVKMA